MDSPLAIGGPTISALDITTPDKDIAAAHLADEQRLVSDLLAEAELHDGERRRVSEVARQLVHCARANRHKFGGVDAFMREYGLSSEEGAILMCVAESLLRIPDHETQDQLIAEKIGEGAWGKHLGHSDSMFVNASTWGLMLTGRVVKLRDAKGASPVSVLKRLVGRSGEPVIRQAIRRAVSILGDQFVLGRTIKEALARAKPLQERGYMFSFDMLGEAARTQADADRYFDRYMSALDAIAYTTGPVMTQHPDTLMRRPSLSVKLSALHPRYEPGKEARLDDELQPKLMTLLTEARQRGISVTIDAEEQDRLELHLRMFGRAYADPVLHGWHGLGLAVQAYSKRMMPQLRWLRRLAERGGQRIPVRLVKGAYWDSEIKRAQELGLGDYPVFTRKQHTDLSFLAGVRFLLSDRKAFYPQFATHNAQSLAAVYVAAANTPFEFQRLHGMGEALYEEVVGDSRLGSACRIYAPVGGHEDLLPYLVRRLLENGANTSFVNRLADEDAPIAEIVRDPVAVLQSERDGTEPAPPPKLIPRPRDIFEPQRRASAGLALTERTVRSELLTGMASALLTPFEAGPLIDGELTIGDAKPHRMVCPHDHRQDIGHVHWSDAHHIEAAITSACRNATDWDLTPVEERARILERAANLFESQRTQLMAVIVREAGKTITAAHDDIREAVDFLRYYAHEARRLFSGPISLPGPTGERNEMSYRARGPFACISPWNFPIAIFTGQVAAALAAGNPVLAKPAEQTPLTAYLATRLLHQAGVPAGVLHLLPGYGTTGAALVRDPRIQGVAFTGSNAAAWAIQKGLADRRTAIVPLIAETGGLNAMIADSSALPEQVVRDVMRSAFDSAGQRCSAARMLFVHEDIAPRTISMLAGAIEELGLGDPMDYATDIGPVIDEQAQDTLDAHKLHVSREARLIADGGMPEDCRAGTYVSPAAYEIERIDMLKSEVFGPILYVGRYQRGMLDKVIDAINATGYGLTLGLHSRINSVADHVARRAKVGNLYVNRNQIGAVVGAQPFGGEGLSGTGPKAGGANYVQRFATERVRSTDITATGGNLDLLRAGNGEA